MAKVPTQSTTFVRSTKTGELVPVRGLGAMKDMPLPLKKGIDLTKPIAAQVFKAKRK
jgi:hypothetical protein